MTVTDRDRDILARTLGVRPEGEGWGPDCRWLDDSQPRERRQGQVVVGGGL